MALKEENSATLFGNSVNALRAITAAATLAEQRDAETNPWSLAHQLSTLAEKAELADALNCSLKTGAAARAEPTTLKATQTRLFRAASEDSDAEAGPTPTASR